MIRLLAFLRGVASRIFSRRDCAGCAALGAEIDALDRGLIEAAGIAHDALTATQALRRRLDAQDEAWTQYREGLAAALGCAPEPRPARRKATRTDRADHLTVVKP